MDVAKISSNTPESKLHFLDYWRIIRIRKTVILAVFLLVVLTTTAVTFVLKPSYMSTARIAVEKDVPDIKGLFEIRGPENFDPYFIQTEFEKIQSAVVLDEVINELGLVKKWGERLGMQGLRVSEARAMLKNQIDVRQSRNTSLIEIRVYSEDKKEAADIANEIAKAYREFRENKTKLRAKAGIDALTTKLDEQNEKVKVLQEEVEKERKSNQLSDIETPGGLPGTMVEAETLRLLVKESIAAEQLLINTEQLYVQLTNKSRADLRKAIPAAAPDATLDKFLSELSQYQQQFTALSKDYGDEHPDVVRTSALIKLVNQQIEDRIDGVILGLETMVAQRREWHKSMVAKVNDAKKLDAESYEKSRLYFQKRRDLENQQRLRDTILFRIVQEQVDRDLPKSSIVQVTDQAEAALRPIRPNIPLNIILGIVVGLVMGVGLAFFIEYLDTSVKTIDDVERALQAPVIGVIPQNVGSLLDEGLDSPHAEAYRVLRTNILFSRKDQTWNTLTVVSGGAGEGKSTTIFNLATVFAQQGQRVLVVDSDLRRPSLHKFLNVSNSVGLTNYLLRQNKLEEVIQTTNVPTLNFLPSGKLPSSSMGVLNSAQMKDFIKLVKERYDFVFFDSPPIMGVSDASILASEVDMALLVVQYRKYPQIMTSRAKQMVEKVGGHLLGVVLNNINISQDSYYYYYSGYYYDYYYSKSDDAEDKGEKGSRKRSEGSKNGETHKAEPRPGVELKKKY